MSKTNTLGPKGTYTYDIALKKAEGNEVVLHASISDVLKVLRSEAGSRAVLPIHNSAASKQPETATLLEESELWSQLVHPIRYIPEPIIMAAGCHPDALENPNFTTVKTKDVAFSQCKPWLNKNHPVATLDASDSTIAGAQKIMNQCLLHAIALGPEEKLKELGLHILDPNVNKNAKGENPTTVFAVLEKLDKSNKEA